MRPEKAAKKSRRSRTSGAIETTLATRTLEKIQQICDMGFTPSTTERVLARQNGDVTQTVSWLLTNGDADKDELAPPRSSRQKRRNRADDKQRSTVKPAEVTVTTTFTTGKRHQDVSSNVSIEADTVPPLASEEPLTIASKDQSANTVASKDSNVKVVILKSKERNIAFDEQVPATASAKRDPMETPSRKAKRRKTTLDQPEPLLEESSPPIMSEPPKEKKRGRGRPRKDAKTTDTVAKEQSDKLQAPSDHNSQTLQEIEPNALTAFDIATPEQEGQAKQVVVETSMSTPELKSTTASTSKETLREAKATTSGSSPLNKGKVYRVGLSKRARIAPLLRFVKK